MVRVATENDIYAMCQLGIAHHIESQLEARSGVKLDIASGEAMIRKHVTHPSYIAVVSEDSVGINGMCIGIISPWPINATVRVAQETVCFGKDLPALRKEFDNIARQRGCEVSMIACFTQTKQDRFRKLGVL